MTAGDAQIGTVELVRESGATFRQIDYWTRRGLLPVNVIGGGSGVPRRYPYSAIALARAYTALSAVMTSPQTLAFEAIRAALDDHRPEVELAPGLLMDLQRFTPHEVPA